MEVGFYYYIDYENGDGSDAVNWFTETTPEEDEYIIDSMLSGKTSEEALLNTDIARRAIAEIEHFEIRNGIELDDPYIVECNEKGVSPFEGELSLHVIPQPWSEFVDYSDPRLAPLYSKRTRGMNYSCSFSGKLTKMEIPDLVGSPVPDALLTDYEVIDDDLDHCQIYKVTFSIGAGFGFKYAVISKAGGYRRKIILPREAKIIASHIIDAILISPANA